MNDHMVFSKIVQKFTPPLTIGFTVDVRPPTHTNFRLVVVLDVLFALTGAAIYVIHIRRKIVSSERRKFNFLDIPWLKDLFQSKYTQPVFQVPLLVVFGVLIILSLIDIQDCQNQAFYAYPLYQKGDDIVSIRNAVDKKFWRPLR